MAEMRLVVCTPRAVVVDRWLRSARLPAESGQFGLRPNSEPMLVAVEPGLLLIHERTRTDYAATAGGLLRVSADRAALYTPFAVTGGSAEEVLNQFEIAHADPMSEIGARRQLEELELKILQELRRGDGSQAGLRRAR